MKVSLNWLTDYVEIPLSAAELGERLMHIGINLEEVLETDTDMVLDLEVTSNRPDCLGHLGVAREVAAMLGTAFRPPVLGKLPTKGKVSELAALEVQAPDLCPRYTARVLRGVKVGPSPQWMVERLEAVGLRSINNIVDVTNYVMMEYSQPLHSFDYDKLAGRKIVVRRARDGELLVSIDQTKCRLTPETLVIADAEKPVAIAGVMGGLNTEVGETTTAVLIESAQFDPLSVRRTSRGLQLMSESNYRFERGVDPVRVDEAGLRACQLILELAGGELAGGVLDAWAAPWRQPTVTLRPQRCDALLGMAIPPERQAELLGRLGLEPRLDDGKIVCKIPSHRGDLTREVDLIEEIARLEGYDKIPVGSRVTHAVRPMGLPTRVRRAVGQALSGAGFDEAQTYTFVDAGEPERLGFARTVAVDPLVRKTNNVLRPTLLCSLLRAVKTNQDAGTGEVCLFEIAAVFAAAPAAGLPEEHVELALVSTGDLRELRGALESAVERINPATRVEVVAARQTGLDEGAAAEVRFDGQSVGRLGMVAPDVLDFYGLEKPVAAATVRFDALLDRAGIDRKYQPLAKFPAVRRDLSVIVDESVAWRQIAETIDSVPQPLRESLEYVTTYRGKPIEPGKKSVTVTLTYRKSDGTLRSEEVDEQVSLVLAALEKKLSASLRT